MYADVNSNYAVAALPPPLYFWGLPPVATPTLQTQLEGVGIDPASEVYRCPGDPGMLYDEVGISYFMSFNAKGSTFANADSSRAVAWDCDGVDGVINRGPTFISLPSYHGERNVLFGDARVEQQGDTLVGFGFD